MKRTRKTREAGPPAYILETASGIGPFLEKEARERLGGRGLRVRKSAREDEVSVTYGGRAGDLLECRLAGSAYLLRTYDVPRPKALLGDVHLRSLISQIRAAARTVPEAGFRSFRFGAAGAGSAVFERLADAIGSESGLAYAPDGGDMLIRIRPDPKGRWEVLTRLTPKPLSARAWRVEDMPGALDANVAALAAYMSDPHPSDRVLDAMCGSATLTIERLAIAPAALAVCADVSETALDKARRNVAAAGLSKRCSLRSMDCSSADGTGERFTVILCNLPWGERIGSRETNSELYGKFLDFAAASLEERGRMVVVTQDTKSLDSALSSRPQWRPKERVKVSQGGFHPSVCRIDLAGGRRG